MTPTTKHIASVVYLATAAMAVVMNFSVRVRADEITSAATVAVTLVLVAIGVGVIVSRRWKPAFNEVESRRRGSRELLAVTALALIALVLIALAAGTGHPGFVDIAIILTVLLVLLLVLWLVLLILAGWADRRWTQRVVVGHLASIVGQNLPLPLALELAARAEQGAARRILFRMAQRLGQGWPLSQAVRLAYPNCPSVALSLIEAGEQAGQLSAALEQANEYIRQRTATRNVNDVNFFPYLIILVTTTGLLVAGQMIAIVPKFKEIFKDYNVPLPRSTLLLISVSGFLTETGLLAILSIAALVAIVLGLYLSFRPRRVPWPTFPSRLGDWIRWHLPGWRGAERHAGLAAVARVMRWGLRAGLDLPEAVTVAAEVDMNVYLRRRLRRFSELLQSGVPAGQAIQRAGLGRVAAIALAGGQRSGDMDTALRYLGDYHQAIVGRWRALFKNMIWPLGTVLMACVIGAVVYAMFEPLVQMLDSVARNVI